MSKHNFVKWDDLFNADSFQDTEFKRTVSVNQAIKFHELNNEGK